MDERRSRRIVLLETVLITAPVVASLPFVYRAAHSLQATFGPMAPQAAVRNMILATLLPIAMGAWLSLGFVLSGRPWLRRTPRWLWIFPTLAGGLVLVRCVCTALTHFAGVHFGYAPTSPIDPFGLITDRAFVEFVNDASVLGLPLLVPLVHLLLEKRRANAP